MWLPCNRARLALLLCAQRLLVLDFLPRWSTRQARESGLQSLPRENPRQAQDHHPPNFVVYHVIKVKLVVTNATKYFLLEHKMLGTVHNCDFSVTTADLLDRCCNQHLHSSFHHDVGGKACSAHCTILLTSKGSLNT